MPRTADHDQRRRQIAEAVWRLAARRGLEDVTLRKVADEAGVSVRLLQYYFGSRDDLLLGALELLNADTDARVRERVQAVAGPDPVPYDVVRTLLVELLPLDDERRTRYLVLIAYFVRSLNDRALADRFRDGALLVEKLVADLLGWARDRGELADGLDLRVEAELLLNSLDGLQTSVVLGQRTPRGAVALIDHQLARVFRGPDGLAARSDGVQDVTSIAQDSPEEPTT